MSTPEKIRTRLIAASDQLLDAVITRDSMGTLMALNEFGNAVTELLGEDESARLGAKMGQMFRGATDDPITKQWFDGMLSMARDYLGISKRSS